MCRDVLRMQTTDPFQFQQDAGTFDEVFENKITGRQYTCQAASAFKHPKISAGFKFVV